MIHKTEVRRRRENYMHDKNGKAIKVGDWVTIDAEITSAVPGVDYCNVTLAVGKDKPHGPDNIQSSITLNAKQVELIEAD